MSGCNFLNSFEPVPVRDNVSALNAGRAQHSITYDLTLSGGAAQRVFPRQMAKWKAEDRALEKRRDDLLASIGTDKPLARIHPTATRAATKGTAHPRHNTRPAKLER